MRLFVAITFSDNIISVLKNAMGQLRKQNCRGNFTNPENLHLTLAFIGETDRLADVTQAMDSCHSRPFTLSVTGSGQFGALYWAGIEKNPELSRLAAQLQSALSSLGFHIDTRALNPHITIARQVDSPGPIRLDVPRVSMAVDHISLMRSDRINGRLIYTEVFSKNLI